MRRLLPLLGLLLAATVAFADNDKKPGLHEGANLPGPFHPYNVTGKHKGKFHCLVCQHGLNPTVMVVLRGAEVPAGEALTKLLKDLNEEVPRRRGVNLGSFVVFVADGLKDVVTEDGKRDKLVRQVEERIDKAAELNDGLHVPAALESPGYLKHYPFDEKAAVTVVLYKGLKVVASFSYPEADKVDGKAILDKVKEMTARDKK